MKTIIVLAFVAACLCGCSRHPEVETITVEVGIKHYDELQSTFGFFQWRMLTNALARSTNAADVLPQLCVEQAMMNMEILASQSVRELQRKLETLERGTSRHGFSKAELLQAIDIKEARAREKANKSVSNR